jgi:hypothetical protein
MKRKSTSQSAPARRSLVRRPVSEGGFFNPRVLILIALFTGSAVAALFAATEGARTHHGGTDPVGAAVGIDGAI